MKNHKLPTFPLWIAIGLFVGLLIFNGFSHIDNHSGFYQFLSNLILVGVTISYVFLTREILKTQKEELEYKMQYLIEPRVLDARFLPSEITIIIKNASAFSAGDVKGFVLVKCHSTNSSKGKYTYYYGETEENAFISGESLEFNLELTKVSSNTKFSTITNIKSLLLPDTIKKLFISEIEQEKGLAINEWAEITMVVNYKKLNGVNEIVLRRCHYVFFKDSKILLHGDTKKLH